MLPKLHIKLERWKYNKTFEVYVSNMGHVRNKSKAMLAPKIGQGGYVLIHVQGSDPKYILLHRLVMLTWRPTPEAEQLTVDHLDHNKRNNSVDNLEWVTREENLRRARQDLAPAKANQELGLTPATTGKKKVHVIGVHIVDSKGAELDILNSVPDEALDGFLNNLYIDSHFDKTRFKFYLERIRSEKIGAYQIKKYCGLCMQAIVR